MALIVAGFVSYDYILYPMSPSRPHSSDADRTHLHGGSADQSEAQLVIRSGNADLVAQFLTAAAPSNGLQVLPPALLPPGPSCLRHHASSFIELRAARDSNDYSVAALKHIGRPPVWHSPPVDQAVAHTAATAIVSGSGEAFTNVEPALDFLQRVRPRYIIHHMHAPLAKGSLWDLVRDGPRTRDGVPEPDFITVIVDADDLRAEGIALSQLSWESAAEDFVRNLGSNGRLDTLVTCPNLIVRFGTEGIVHHRGRDASNPKLYYHPRMVEQSDVKIGQPPMPGLASAFTAGFALGFAGTRPDHEKGIRLGIEMSQRLAELGFVRNAVDQAPDYPIAQIMEDLRANRSFASVSIPSSRISSGDKWSIFDSVTGDPNEVARQIVTMGPDKALASCPVQRFEQLWTVERSEQENIRGVVGAVQERLLSASMQPTSIAILGSAGAGKKFTATNLATYLSNQEPMRRLTYDTRLLKSSAMLVAACHEIRNSTVAGVLTVVVFENFEAALEGKGDSVMNEFLAIIRAGSFTDRGHVHTLGAPLMFVIVNEVTAPPPVTSPKAFNTATDEIGKSLDYSVLLDNVHGIVRVAGPNQQGSADRMYPIRRALMLRQILSQRSPHLQTDGEIKIEEGVLHALLLVPSYKHGLRSLDRIISVSRLSGRKKFDVAALPPEEQIQSHVDGKIFMSYLRAPRLPPALREKLAEGLFDTYKKRRVAMTKSDEERKALQSERSMRDWDELPPELKESTRSQADDIPRKLRAIGCFMLEEDRPDPLVRVPTFSEQELDLLAEMEHERFNAERLQRQWRMGPRNSKDRTTPFLVPWRDLAQEWRDVDRVMVEVVPSILDKAGWRIYRVKNEDEEQM